MPEDTQPVHSGEIRIPQRQLLDWLLTGGVLAMVVGFAWMWAPLGLITGGAMAVYIALRGSRAGK